MEKYFFALSASGGRA